MNDNEKIELLFQDGLKYIERATILKAMSHGKRCGLIITWSGDLYKASFSLALALFILNGISKVQKSLLNKSIEKFEEFNGTLARDKFK